MKTPLPIPTTEEQEAVVNTLRTVRQVVDATQDVIDAATEVRRSLMRHLMTHGMTSSTDTETSRPQETAGLPVRSDWETISLGQAAKWLSGGTPKTSVEEYWDGEIPWISASNLKTFFLRSSRRRITPLGANNGSRVVPAGTTLAVVRGMSLVSEWRVGFTEKPMAFGQDCKAMIPAEQFDPLFFACAVKAQEPEVLRLVDRAGHGTGRLAMNLLQQVEIPVPPMADQVRIANSLQSVDNAIAAELDFRWAMRTFFDSLLEELVTGQLGIGSVRGSTT